MLFLAGFVAYAWTEPGSVPPSGNVEAPINVGATSQTFVGSKTLNLNSLGSGSLLLHGLLNVTRDAIFDGNVGIGTTTPNEKLEVLGGIKADFLTIVGSPVLPLCDSSKRGKNFLLQGSAGIEDSFYICKKKTDGTYTWIALGSPKVETAAYWDSFVFWAGNTWQEVTFGFPPVPVTLFYIPSDAKQWVCNYTVKGECGASCCGSGQTRVICDGSDVYTRSHGISFSTSNMARQSSNNANCRIQVKSDCPPPATVTFNGLFGGSCYYVK